MLFDGSIREFLVLAAPHAQLIVRIANRNARFVIAICDVGTPVVFFHPGVDVLDIEGDDLTQSRDLFFERNNGGSQQLL